MEFLNSNLGNSFLAIFVILGIVLLLVIALGAVAGIRLAFGVRGRRARAKGMRASAAGDDGGPPPLPEGDGPGDARPVSLFQIVRYSTMGGVVTSLLFFTGCVFLGEGARAQDSQSLGTAGFMVVLGGIVGFVIGLITAFMTGLVRLLRGR